MAQKLKNNFGFTVIELMVVVVIIGVVAGAIVLRNQGATDQAVFTKAKAFSASIPVSLAGNYVAEWKFDQINIPSANVTPSSWGGYNGTLSGTVLPTLQTTNCVYDNCLNFDGTASYVAVSDDLSTGLKALTIEGWFNGHQATNGQAGTNILQTDTNSIILHFRGAGFYLIASDNTASGYLGWDSTLPYNTWTHLAATWDGTTMRLFVNGVRQPTTLAYSGGTGHVLKASNSLFIGRLFNTWQYWFYGQMDNVRFYSDGLSISQIQQDYRAGLERLLATKQISPAEYASRITQLNQNIVKK